MKHSARVEQIIIYIPTVSAVNKPVLAIDRKNNDAAPFNAKG